MTLVGFGESESDGLNEGAWISRGCYADATGIDGDDVDDDEINDGIDGDDDNDSRIKGVATM